MTGVPILVPILTAVAIALALVGVAILVRVIDADWFYRRFVGPATPGTLGALRMLTCTIALISTLWEDLPSTTLIPGELLRPMGVLSVLTTGPLAPIAVPLIRNPAALELFQGITALFLVFGIIGLWTRFSIPAAAICYLFMGGMLRQYCWLFHTCLAPIYMLLLFCFLPSGDGWSIDRLRRVASGKPVPSPDVEQAIYGWGRYLCWLMIALYYMAAGLSKLSKCGIAWCDATNFRSYIYTDTLNPMQFNFSTGLLVRYLPDWMVSLMAACGMFGEILFGLVLISVTARYIMPIAMLLMHIGILFLQNILFFDLILIQLVFFDLSGLARSIGRRLRTFNGDIVVQFDSLNPASLQTANVMRRFDLFRRFSFKDLQSENTDATVSSLTVTHGQHVYSGNAAFRKLALSVPVGWLFYPILLVPGGVTAISAFLNLPQDADKSQAIDASKEAEQDGEKSTIERTKKANWIFAPLACGLAALWLACWAQRVEQYPMTAMQMYTTPNHDGVIYYFKYLAQFENGDIQRAPIEECIGAMRDSRYRRFNGIIAQGQRLDIPAKFFINCGKRYNEKAEPGHRITGFKVEIWEWDYFRYPTSPERAEEKHAVEFSVEVLDQSDDVSVFTSQATGSQPL